MFPAARHNNLIGVRVDDQIGIVCDDDDLPTGLRLPEPFDQIIINRFGVKVLFGLVENQRPDILSIDREINQQQDDAPRSRRELLNVDALILKSVCDLYMIRAEQPGRNLVGPGFPRVAGPIPSSG